MTTPPSKRFPGTVLIVDDDEHVLVTSRMILKQYFEVIETLASPKTLESKLRQQRFDVIVLDMNFRAGVTSGNEGIFWLTRIMQLAPLSQVVLQTAYGDIEMAVRSIREGAVDFLPKPWTKEKLVSSVINAWQLASSKKENKELRSRQKALHKELNPEQQFIATAPSMKPVLDAIENVAVTDANVMILGENGSGKEMAARAIHNRSMRADGPFIHVDMGAVPATLFESEMFGHEKGAFTDARETRIGKFELAHGGTLFLDEIGNLAPELQVKLLSALQGLTITRVGGNDPIRLNIRLICATNAPILELVKKGQFRQDLYYRVNTVEIPLPPLRQRKEDIPLLARHYFDEFTRRYNKPAELSDDAVTQLARYPWPGNVRELRHSVERAVILCKNPKVSIEDFQLNPISNTESAGGSLNLTDVEREVIQQALRKSAGNLTRAAEELGIGRTTLYRKIEEYGLTVLER